MDLKLLPACPELQEHLPYYLASQSGILGIDVKIGVFPAIWSISCQQLGGLTGPCVPKKEAAETISALLWSAIFMVDKQLPIMCWGESQIWDALRY